jgi:hypothetical protein
MTLIKMPVPEHSLRHRGKSGVSLSQGVCAARGPSKMIAAWPLTAEDAPPIAWWRMLPSGLFHDVECLLMQTTLDRLVAMKEDRKWSEALRGDATAAVGIAISAMPIKETVLETDVTMTAVLHCALSGDATAALVLAHVLDHADLGHPFGNELSASWRTQYRLRRRRRDLAFPHQGGQA